MALAFEALREDVISRGWMEGAPLYFVWKIFEIVLQLTIVVWLQSHEWWVNRKKGGNFESKILHCNLENDSAFSLIVELEQILHSFLQVHNLCDRSRCLLAAIGMACSWILPSTTIQEQVQIWNLYSIAFSYCDTIHKRKWISERRTMFLV